MEVCRCRRDSIEVCRSEASSDARLVQHVEEIEERAHVQRKSMIGDPAADGHADRGDTSCPRNTPGKSATHGAMKVELLEHLQDDLGAADRHSPRG